MIKFWHYMKPCTAYDPEHNTYIKTNGVTFAWEERKYDNNQVFLESSIAYCSLKDQFARKVGRDISEGRLKKHKRIRKEMLLNPSLKDILAELKYLWELKT